jgi:hypothetical protein
MERAGGHDVRVLIPVPRSARESSVTEAPTYVHGDRIRCIGVLDNNLDPPLMRGMVRSLTAAWPGVEIRVWQKPTAMKPAPEELLAEVAAVAQYAVAGVGLCGSCTAGSLVDAASLWKLGVPTTALVWQGFERTAKAHTSMQGVPDLPVQLVPDLKIGESEIDHANKAEAAVDAIRARWSRPSAILA